MPHEAFEYEPAYLILIYILFFFSFWFQSYNLFSIPYIIYFLNVYAAERVSRNKKKYIFAELMT